MLVWGCVELVGVSSFLLPGSKLSHNLVELESFLAEKAPVVRRLDNFEWMLNAFGDYNVRSCYDLFFLCNQHCVFEEYVVLALKEMWSSKIPSKIHIFS